MFKGTGVSVGIGLARAIVLRPEADTGFYPRKSARPSDELERFEAARRHMLAANDLLRKKTARQIGADEAAIFDAYHMMLEDEDSLLGPLRAMMRDYHYSAEYSVTLQFDELARQFLRMDDAYMRQRVDDVFSLRDELMRELTGMQKPDLSHLDRPTIIVARSLSPSEMAAMDLSRLEGVVCEAGGYASHVAIICRSLGIPAVMAAPDVAETVWDGELLALDGESGEVWAPPDEAVIEMLHRRGDELARRRADAQMYRGRPTISTDGHRIELAASAGSPEELDAALEADAESLGLFRTEQMFLESPAPPGEDEQLAIYRAMLEKMRGKAATVRTFDDGGNRPSALAGRGPEENPALGLRGIRMSLGRPSFFRTQLRALLRASVYGSLRVMFPMVSGLAEVDEALRALSQIKDELRREGLAFDDKMPVGVVVDVPAAALLSDAIAKKVDFLAVNIDELIQFTLAADRGNPDLAHLYYPHHPAVLRLVRMTVDAAHRQGIPCALGGDARGQEQVLPLLLGMGVDSFVVNPGQLLRCRQMLNQCSYAECQRLAAEVMEMEATSQVAQRLAAFVF